ncbi:hypothetical protein M0805_009828 [Coniferiporia weirii]|nr:hypothetical protein M0805_009828 [Coniferiporia weirii]
MVALAPVQLSANAVTPSSGSSYVIQNLGFGHVLDDESSSTTDGNPILSDADGSNESNQLWTYLTYPTSDGSTVFTLQSLFTSQHEPSFDGRGGFIRIDSTTNKLVQGGAPFAWTLIEVAPSIYQFTPYDDVFSSGGRLVVTDVNSAIDTATPTNNQAALQINIESLEQLWSFNAN